MKKALYILVTLAILNAFLGLAAYAQDAPPAINFPFGDQQEEDPDEDPDDTEQPPELIPAENGDDNNPDSLFIIDADGFPVGFNPLLDNTTITYELSEDAAIDIKILDANGSTVVTLVDDEFRSGNEEHFTVWDGTDSINGGGTVVPPGEYTFKLTAKDPDTDEVMDTATGEFNLFYSLADDFEEPDLTEQEPENDPDAVMTLNNNTSGETPDVGTPMFLYLLAPFGGYIITKRKK